MAYGMSFQPSEDNAQGGSGNPKVGTQNAVQLLSLRMPTITGGARAIAPEGLLASQGGAAVGGAPDKNALLMWLKKLLAQSGADEPPQLGGDSGGFGGEFGGGYGDAGGAPPAPPDVNPMGGPLSPRVSALAAPNRGMGLGDEDVSGAMPAPTGEEMSPVTNNYHALPDPFDVEGGY